MRDPRRMHLKLDSRAVHAGERPPVRDFVPVSTPIYPSSSFVYEDLEAIDAALGGAEGVFAYSRYGNPTVEAMEIAIAALEEQEAAIGFASGMGAVNAAILATARSGDRIVASRDLYGATVKLLGDVYRSLGVETVFVDILDLEAVRRAVEAPNTRAIICESVSNPLLRVTDLEALGEIARQSGVALIVDNTFATPWLLRPGAYGADLVVHSSTKYLGGHGDVTAGAIATSSERRRELNELNKATGSVLGAFEAWLVLRGIKTLTLRLERQCRNAMLVAQWLRDHPKIEKINYPGLPSHESHRTARRLFGERGYGAMVSFDIRNGDRAGAFRFMRALQMIAPATTLGDVYSEVLYPVMASHRALTPEQRREVGIGEGLIRLSVGIEDPADIIEDLERALDAV